MQVNLSRVAITSLMELHPVIGNVFVESLCQREAKKLKLKNKNKGPRICYGSKSFVDDFISNMNNNSHSYRSWHSRGGRCPLVGGYVGGW